LEDVMKRESLAVVMVAAVGLVSGCTSTGGGSGGGSDTNDFPAVTGVVRRAVVVGLTAVDPRAYGGWDGACPGCDVDASAFALLCREQGLQVAELHNAAATVGKVKKAGRAAWKDMKAGDLFVLFVSGHGGQVKDEDDDEDDGKDETLCLWDGQCTDDYLRALWEEIPAGVRVLYVTDTCNSGTNYKGGPRLVGRSLPRGYEGAMIHFGGCADGESSYGSAQGGSWTTALIDGWSGTNSYRGWFDGAAVVMPAGQVPVYAEYGAVTAAFRDGVALR
jgi:hypothetical protein